MLIAKSACTCPKTLEMIGYTLENAKKSCLERDTTKKLILAGAGMALPSAVLLHLRIIPMGNFYLTKKGYKRNSNYIGIATMALMSAEQEMQPLFSAFNKHKDLSQEIIGAVIIFV